MMKIFDDDPCVRVVASWSLLNLHLGHLPGFLSNWRSPVISSCEACMGIHGLSTYLKENKRHVARSLEFTNPRPGASSGKDPKPVFVVDGWSYVYPTNSL